MKKILLSILICCAFIKGYSQADSTISLDILRAPTHPSFLLLGISPESIETPQDPTSLLVSLRNATDNFGTLPKSYAIDIAPAWVFKNDISAASFLNSKGDRPLANMWQTLQISLATHTPSNGIDSNLTQMGIGFKTSIFRGNKLAVDWDSSRQKLDSIRSILKNKNTLLADYISKARQNDTELKRLSDLLVEATIAINQQEDSLIQNPALSNNIAFVLRKSKLEGKKSEYLTRLNYRNKNLLQEASKHIDDSLKSELTIFKKLTSEIKFRRYGWKLDLAGGVVLNYPNQNFDYSILTRYGAWLTGGYETKKAVNFLGVARVLLNPDEMYLSTNDSMRTADNLNFDVGAKIEWLPQGGLSKFRISGEGIYRTTLNATDLKDRLRYTINIGYPIEKNTLLNFSVGKNFDTPTQLGGNLIAALNLLVGFGNSRPVLK